jgi:hypothetical protein
MIRMSELLVVLLLLVPMLWALTDALRILERGLGGPKPEPTGMGGGDCHRSTPGSSFLFLHRPSQAVRFLTN